MILRTTPFEYKSWAYLRWGKPMRFHPRTGEEWNIDNQICNLLREGVQVSIFPRVNRNNDMEIEWDGDEGLNYEILPKQELELLRLMRYEFLDHFHNDVQMMIEGDGVHKCKKKNQAIEYWCNEYNLDYIFLSDRLTKDYDRWRFRGRLTCLDNKGLLEDL